MELTWSCFRVQIGRIDSGVGKAFYKRSLTLAVYTVLLTLFSLSPTLFFFREGSAPHVVVLYAGLVFICSIALFVYGVFNLVKDVDRGYSPDRCSLACVVYLGAFLLQAWIICGVVYSWLASGSG